MEEQTPVQAHIPESFPPRPFLLTLLCLFSYIFFGLISLIFLAALFYSGSITWMVLRYTPENPMTRTGIFFYIFGGFLFHALSFTGTLLIWKLKKKGYFLFGVSTLIIAVYQLFSSRISPLTTAVYIFLILAFGFFLRKMR
ncbi:MAG: hypothetical protein NTU98_13355 [Bacteroidetes bacterium]|nr:hypothetical protein [Bacteroidota bacterium]